MLARSECESFFRFGFLSSNVWPQEEGSIVQRDNDPTFGTGGLTEGASIYECLVCGAAVLSYETHVRWHQQQTTTTEGSIDA